MSLSYRERNLLYLEQQLETGDALEGENQEGLEGKALADGVALQLLQDLPETAVATPVRVRGSDGEQCSTENGRNIQEGLGLGNNAESQCPGVQM